MARTGMDQFIGLKFIDQNFEKRLYNNMFVLKYVLKCMGCLFCSLFTSIWHVFI